MTKKSPFGARVSTEVLPTEHIPKDMMNPDEARFLIDQQLRLDARPVQNLASFVTTWMEEQADDLISKSLTYNLVDQDEYPHIVEIENHCVEMLSNLYHAPEPGVGTSTVGSSEAMMLAGLAMKWRWRQHAIARGDKPGVPNLIMGENVQVCWEKFAKYFDVEPKYIPVEEGNYVITPEMIREHVDENTIGVCAILGTTFTGDFEPIRDINNMLMDLNKEKGWDVPIHMDGASGGFVAPFLYPDLGYDFRLPLVRSVNISGHKYGLVYPGVGWVLWRDKASLPEDLIFHVNYLGGDQPTFNLNFSRPAAFVIAQYYNLVRLGMEGYQQVMQGLKLLADHLTDELTAMPDFVMMSRKETLPVVVFQVKEGVGFDAFELSDKLRQYGWVVPAYSMPKNAEHVAALRVVIREGISHDLVNALVADIKRSVDALKNGKRQAQAFGHMKNKKSRKPC